MNDAKMALLSQLVYLNPPQNINDMKIPGGSVKNMVDYYMDDKGNLRNFPKIDQKNQYKFEDALRLIAKDDELMGLTVAGYLNQNAGGGNGLVAYCFESNNGEAVYAFRGTEDAALLSKDGWDNIKAPFSSTKATSQQEMALAFVDRMNRENKYSATYATGHSLGGNLAQYVTLFGDIDRCAAFNARGFTKESRDKYREIIDARGDKITNYINEYDKLNNTQGKVFLWNVGYTQTMPRNDAKTPEDAHSMLHIINEFERVGDYRKKRGLGYDDPKNPYGASTDYSLYNCVGSTGLHTGGSGSGSNIVSAVSGMISGIVSGAVASVKATAATAAAGSKQQITLNHPAALAIATKMKSSAAAFGSNQQKLVRAVATLGSSWSGNISDAMQSELKDMNQDVANIQATLSELAEFALKSANLLKDVDTALGTGISGRA